MQLKHSSRMLLISFDPAELSSITQSLLLFDACWLSMRLGIIQFVGPGELRCSPGASVHSFTNNSQSAISCALRIRADAGNSFGARGTLSNFRPVSCGRRLPFFVFTSLLDQTRFSHASLPPRERGTTWSRLP